MRLEELTPGASVRGIVRDASVTVVNVQWSIFSWQTDGFAYAESHDEAAGRYRGLRSGALLTPTPEDPGLLVKPDIARHQLAAETPAAAIPSPASPSNSPQTTTPTTQGNATAPPASLARRFHGTVRLDPTRTGRDASRIAEEIIAHLATLPGATVTVTLDIEAHLPQGTPDPTLRTITENARTLKFTTHAFEDE